MATATQLSPKDAAVLSALFDPEASLGNAIQITPSQTTPQISPEERRAIQLLNNESPAPKDVEEAISILTSLIESAPTSPLTSSTYVNRAQARRLLLPDQSTLTSSSSQLLALILSDLSTAINLSTPTSPTAPVPAATAHLLSSAHTHRAYILYLLSRPSTSTDISSSIPALSNQSKDQLEEMASTDFAAGGRYGNPLAREMSVRTNPYAKLCGEIVKEAMRREIDEYFEAQGDGKAVEFYGE